MSDLIHRDYLEDCQQSRAALAERLATVEAERDRLRAERDDAYRQLRAFSVQGGSCPCGGYDSRYRDGRPRYPENEISHSLACPTALAWDAFDAVAALEADGREA